jgi:hypothetical protein
MKEINLELLKKKYAPHLLLLFFHHDYFTNASTNEITSPQLRSYLSFIITLSNASPSP